MRTHSLSHTHILPCNKHAGTHLLIYTHAHTPCTCMPTHTRAHRCRHACKNSQSLFSPAESSGSCLAPGHVFCRWHMLAHRWWLLPCSSALAGEMQHMFKESGQQKNKLCLTFFQPQRPPPHFSSWGGEGGDLPSMKGKTLTANASGGQVSLCQMNAPTPGPAGRGVRGSLVLERTRRLQAGL